MSDAKVLPQIMPLHELYLNVIVSVANEENLEAVQQDTGPNAGNLYLVRAGTTVPEVIVGYKFMDDSVGLTVVTRDQRDHKELVKYAEGIDGYAEKLQKLLRANRLTVIK